MNEFIPPPPMDETGGRDVLEVAIAGALNAVPGVGGWLSIGLQKIFAQQEQQRLNTYLSELARVVNKLIERGDGLTAEDLATTPEFYEAAVKAARVATATASREKHSALQNALFNIGTDTAADTDLRMVFIRCIDELTDTHVRILREFADVGGQYIQVESLRTIVGGGAGVDLYVADLQVRGLVEERPIFTRGGGHMTMFSSAVEGGHRISGIGNQFLDFVAGPFDGGTEE